MQPCFTTTDRRAVITPTAEGLKEIVQGKLGGNSTAHLRRLLADIKRVFPALNLPSTSGLRLNSMLDIFGKLARPNTYPDAEQLWSFLSPQFGARHGNGPELLMVIRVLDWIALMKVNGAILDKHALEISDQETAADAAVALLGPVITEPDYSGQFYDREIAADPAVALLEPVNSELDFPGLLFDREFAQDPAVALLEPVNDELEFLEVLDCEAAEDPEAVATAPTVPPSVPASAMSAVVAARHPKVTIS